MTDGERARVGQALESLRGALSSYVDEAMANAYGNQWDDVVAEDDAKRRRQGRKWPVAKNDLAVMLKVLIHRRIEPWGGLRDYPRVRAFASEILTLRNLHAHGDECADEYGRLTDTGGRMLTLLGLPVPEDLRTPVLEPAMIPVGDGAGQFSARQVLAPPASRGDAELARLGGVGEEVGTILGKSVELSLAIHNAFQDGLAELDPEAPDFDTFRDRFSTTALSVGEQATGLLAELEQIEIAAAEPKDPMLALLVLMARRQLTTESVRSAIELHRLDLSVQQVPLLERSLQRRKEMREAARRSEDPQAYESLPSWDPDEDPDIRELGDRVAEVDRLLSAMGSDNFSQAIRQVASQLGDASQLANWALAMESLDAARSSKDDEGHWTRDAVPHFQDAIARLRFEGGMEPGSVWETGLVFALRLEGEVYNDIGQPDDALQSFARAAEIVDRYPSADPDL